MPTNLNAHLAEQRRLSCRCGARTTRPGTLCTKCRRTALWQPRTGQPKRATRTARCMAARLDAESCGARHCCSSSWPR